MLVEQIYTGCLAQGAYYIESNGEAVVIDPLRESEPYISRAAHSGARIKYVLETHFHADFVSGHLELARATGAQIVFGPGANTGFGAHNAKDGERLKVGELEIEVLHTPGHTPESTTYLLRDPQGRNYALFTGDTLFIGDVGRPDLAAGSSLSTEDMAGMLYDSLRNKIMPLGDEVIVYPAHGAGSACGKNMSKETNDTLGHQKQVNYALRADLSKGDFILELTTGIPAPPAYFPLNVHLNKHGYAALHDVLSRGTRPLTPEAFRQVAEQEQALILDTRKPEAFAAGHIPGSINIGIDGGFAPWVGTLIPDIGQRILLVTDPGREQEVVTRMARVGYDHAMGYLDGGLSAWVAAGFAIDRIHSISVEEFVRMKLAHPDYGILDVRKPGEYQSEHLEEAELLPLDSINELQQKINPNRDYFVHCAGGYRSMIFVSIQKARGFHRLINVEGGMAAIRKSGQFTLQTSACSSH